MNGLRFLPLVAVVLLGTANARAANEDFSALMDAGRYPEAAETGNARAKAAPDDPAALFNAGLTNALAGQPDVALPLFRRVLTIERNDFLAAAKIVQCLQALKDEAELGKAIAQVREIRDRLATAGDKSPAFFTREQFATDGKNLLVQEHFELTGDRAIKWAFLMVDAKGAVIRRISLGSSDSTTRIAREMGEISADQRIWHLDEYEGASHFSLAFYKECPTYAETRAKVIERLAGKVEPLSSTVPSR